LTNLKYGKASQAPKKRKKKADGYDGAEADLQRLCNEFLDYMPYLRYIRIPDELVNMPFWLVRVSPKALYGALQKLCTACGLVKGYPDLTILYKGRYLCVELKNKNGRRHQAQLNFAKAVDVVVIRDFDIFKKTITDFIRDVDNEKME